MPVGLRLSPTSDVSRHTEHDFVMAQILSALVCISTTGSGCSQQSKPQGFVVMLFGKVLAIRQPRNPVRPPLIGKIDSLIRSNLELSLLSTGSLNCADVPVI